MRLTDLAWCALLSLAIGVVIVTARRLAFGIAARTAAHPGRTLVAAGALVGLIAVAFREATDRPVDLVLFSGQSELPAIATEGAGGVLILVVVAKALAYALSLGAGFRGGPIFPAIAFGTALSVAAADLLPGLEPTAAIAAGIAASVAVILRAPFSATLLATVLLGEASVDTAPIAVLAAVIGVMVGWAVPDPSAEREEARSA